MIKKSGKCDGLIISGHHLGHFAHNDIKLVLKDIEKLSCDDKYKDWFNQVKSLWLLGCNTVADKYIKNQTDRIQNQSTGTTKQTSRCRSCPFII